MLATVQLAAAQTGNPPQAVDDLRLVLLTQDRVQILHSSLITASGADPATASVVLERAPLHGQLSIKPSAYGYYPSDTFWALGSDQLVYRLETPAGTSYATVHLVARRFPLGQFNAITFDDPTDSHLLQRPGLSFETEDPIKGSGSLQVRASEAGGTSYFTVPFSVDIDDGGSSVEPVATDNGNTDFCLGGLPDPENTGGEAGFSLQGPAGHIVLIGPPVADLETAVVRVGLESDLSGLFLEVKSVRADGTERWHRTATLPRRSKTLRVQVSFEVTGGKLAALLRYDGLALHSPVVSFHGPYPIVSHLGFFQPPEGGTPLDLELDTISVAVEDETPSQGPGIVGSLLMADGVQGDGTSAWVASYGAGLQASALPLTGDSGLELSTISGVSFASYQLPSTVVAEQLSLRARIDTSAVSIGDGRRLAIANIHSHEHPLYGGPEYELRLSAYEGQTIASFRFHEGDDVWHGLDWTPVNGEQMFRVQIGRSDGPKVDNGWARLWLDGEIVQEVFDLDNYHLALRTVHLGAKYFNSDYVSGTIRFDEVTVTK